jgi:hypothetical protein
MDKSEARKQYKQDKRPMGVYRIINTGNEKSFVGFGTEVQARINRHQAELKFGSHRNRELQEEWKSFGASSFRFEVLDELKEAGDSSENPLAELRVLAEMWIQRLEKAGTPVVRLS